MNRRLLNWIGIGAGVVLILFFYARFAYLPLAKRAAERKQVLTQLQQEVARIQTLLDHYQVNADRAEHIRMQRQLLEDQLPDQANIAELLKAVTRAAAECQIRDFTFRPQPRVEEAEVARQPVKLTITCGYHSLGLFLSKLAALPRLVNAGPIQMVSRDKTGKTDSISVEMVLETYVQKHR